MYHRIRHIIAKLYWIIWNYKITAISGKAAAIFYKLVYPGFTINGKYNIWGRFHVTMFDPSKGSITIGKNFHMVSSSRRSSMAIYAPSSFTTFQGASILVGNDVGMNGTIIASKKKITIGDNCMFAPNVVIIDSDFHVLWPPEKRFYSNTEKYDKAVTIGKNVWVGTNSIILKGVTIGDNSVIGAGSVVSTDIPENVVAAGNPAKIIRSVSNKDNNNQ